MKQTIEARELSVGDYIKAPEGLVYFFAIPFDKSQTFTARYMNRQNIGAVTYEPDELVEVLCRWPEVPS